MELASIAYHKASRHTSSFAGIYNTLENLENFELGKTDTRIALDTSDDNRIAALALAQQAQRTIRIFTRDLEALVYNTQEFIVAVTGLASLGQYSHVLILIQDSTYVVKNGHRLVELAYRLSSKIKLRKPCYEYRNYNEAFLVADKDGLIHRRLADRYEGTASFHNPMEARKLAKFFDEVWEKSEPDPELRRLYL